MVIDITTPDGVETVRIQGDPFLDALDQEILRLGGLTNAGPVSGEDAESSGALRTSAHV